MSVLVTGGAGYIGSHIVKALVAAGEQVVVLDNLSKGHRQAVDNGVLAFRQGDIADRELVGQIVSDYQVTGVIHMAADSLVGESMSEPVKYYNHNVIKGLAFLETLLAAGVRQVVFSSTAAVYGEPTIKKLITEAFPTHPTNVYGRTKLVLEGALADYDRAYGMKSVALRYFNAAGADPAGQIGEDHQPESHLIPLVLQAALGVRENITIFGEDYPTPDGTCLRDYIHVNDLAQAHILALKHLAAGGDSKTYNLGNGLGFSVRQVIEIAAAVTGRTIPTLIGPRRAGDPAVLVAGSEQIRRELGWCPQYSGLREIVEHAWKWHLAHPQGYL